jgi:16S rRNA (cytosine967-C5)-methyltransferase
MNARQTALHLIQDWLKSRRFADECLELAFADSSLSPADRGLATELFYGWLRNRSALEFLLSLHCDRPPRDVVALILQLGFYQLFYLHRIPEHAAIHESVELVKSKATGAEAKFANAVLRRAVRERTGLRAKLDKLRLDQPWVYHSHPQWLWNRWVGRWGAPAAAALCEWNNTTPDVYVRGDKPWPGVLEPSGLHPLSYRVADAQKFFQSPGTYYAQDPSTLTAVDALDPQPGESVLDMCSAPGGKTTYIAQKMQNRGQIIAADESSSRLQTVAENCRRLDVTIVATLACGGTRLDRCLRGSKFHRVLVDAPCSNTGVMRRRPDLRWRIREDEITRLAELQYRLLAAAGHFVLPGGVLVYSTCSIESEENERVVEKFRQAHPQFVLESTRSLIPPAPQMDGAFVARFKAK